MKDAESLLNHPIKAHKSPKPSHYSQLEYDPEKTKQIHNEYDPASPGFYSNTDHPVITLPDIFENNEVITPEAPSTSTSIFDPGHELIKTPDYIKELKLTTRLSDSDSDNETKSPCVHHNLPPVGPTSNIASFDAKEKDIIGLKQLDDLVKNGEGDLSIVNNIIEDLVCWLSKIKNIYLSPTQECSHICPKHCLKAVKSKKPPGRRLDSSKTTKTKQK